MPDDSLDSAQRRLTTKRARLRRQKLGPPLDVDDATLTELAEVGPSIMPEVEAYVRDAAGEEGVKMLRATREG